jgi:SOS-response transcriptional repressor LexA
VRCSRAASFLNEKELPVNLKGLIYRELAEGLTEKDLAQAVGVSRRTIVNILADRIPKDPAVWRKFARYFRMDVDFLRTGRIVGGVAEPSHSKGTTPAVPWRSVPLVSWHHMQHAIAGDESAVAADPDTVLETDVSGTRTFALRVRDDSMNPLFSEGEIIFVDPDEEVEAGHYVVAGDEAVPEKALLRELRDLGGRPVLHPLNRRYPDLPLTTGQRIWGRVVRLRKNL